HDVGVVSRVGEELLMHYGEQILLPQPLQDRFLVGRDRGWVGVVNHHRLYRGTCKLRQRVTQTAHVDNAARSDDRTCLRQLWPLQCLSVELKRSAGGKLQPSTKMFPGP